ncbi:MAG: class I SAM-dependent methyltransferase, partial [Gammaproteobacteria bacterium]|nr:class I SAM-dependent methyltransferase [Gammaproteobacteria bacterium]
MIYDTQIDLSVINNSHTQLIRRIPKGAAVLELGCATGYMSAYLTQALNCEVTGVEIDPEAAEQARAHCKEVITTDIEQPGWEQQLPQHRYDLILCADIIEHLRNPADLLRRLQPHLKQEGVLLASIPNAAHASIRLEMLEGRITYEQEGLLDRSHLHFYTYASIQALMAAAGFKPVELSYTFHDIADDIIRERLQRVGLEASDRFLQQLHAPEAVAYQFIIVAQSADFIETGADNLHELHDNPLQESMEVYHNLLNSLHNERTARSTHLKMIEERDAALSIQHQRVVELNNKSATLEQQIASLTSDIVIHINQLSTEQEQRQICSHALWALQQQIQRAEAKIASLIVENANREKEKQQQLQQLEASQLT